VEDGTNSSTTTPPQGIAIPRSRQSSSTNLVTMKDDPSSRRDKAIYMARNPRWSHEALLYVLFPCGYECTVNDSDVLGDESELLVTVYDRKNQETFLGRVKLRPKLVDKQVVEQWFKLEPRTPDESVSGEIKLYWTYESVERKHLGPEDFDVMRLIGRGTFGQVYQVRKKDTGRIYAMKVLSKKVIVQKKEVAHTIGERNILVRTAKTSSPFIVSLKFSFQTPTDLYLVTDYMSGGELFWHLQKEGKFPEQRAKFYIAELVLALENLHSKGIVYRDLKPENILLDVNGHVALCDFGLSKANLRESDTTNTFCGTTEYLAPEVLLDEQGTYPFCLFCSRRDVDDRLYKVSRLLVTRCISV
jgi:serine/threonine protein kinase SCH9